MPLAPPLHRRHRSPSAAPSRHEPTPLVRTSAHLWRQMPAPVDDSDDTIVSARVGPSIATSDVVRWVNSGSWDELAAHWPSLDPNQRVTAVYAIGRVPLPPGYTAPATAPTDWLVAMALVSRREALLSGAALDSRQWSTAWEQPSGLLPDALRQTAAAAWLEQARTSDARRDGLRRAALRSRDAGSLAFDFVWQLARPLTDDTVEAVIRHPGATRDALIEASKYSPLSDWNRARLAVNPAFPADRVPGLYRRPEPERLAALLNHDIHEKRLLKLLEQPFERWVARELVVSQPHARGIALKMRASTRALTTLFDALDLSCDTELRDAALGSTRVAARAALAAASSDPAVLATLATDTDPRVRATAARRVLDALSPADQTAEELSA